jgi:glycosyltransferase involved in cell wall biosynthesis
LGAAVTVPVDVCLIAEGSYPYIIGGVSSWTHQLVCGLPDVRFALVSLVPDKDFTSEQRYAVPDNVVVRQDVVMFPAEGPQVKGAGLSRELISAIEAMHAASLATRCPFFATVEQLLRSGGQTAAGLLAARATWDLIQSIYRKSGRHVSFLDYYWTWRAIHAPLFRLLEAQLPAARVYHPISTGYAGFAGAIAGLRTGAGVVLTEHGLYTREREIEIAQAPWIYEPPARGSAFAPRDGFFHDWWRAKYQFLERLTYDRANCVVHLHGVNAQAQIDAGADPSKIVVVPNGIRIERFIAARERRQSTTRPFEVALVGRVVPVKDVLTFLRAVHLAAHEVPLVAHVLGPTDEDPVYYQECLSLVKLLGLENVVDFPGKVDVATWLARVDLVISTSITESQPLALLEAMAASVPVVATDVGACREMLEGRPGDDALLGASGVVVPVVSPGLVAAALVELSRDPARRQIMGESGVRRVERFYTEERFLAAYRSMYRGLALKGKRPAAPVRAS